MLTIYADTFRIATLAVPMTDGERSRGKRFWLGLVRRVQPVARP